MNIIQKHKLIHNINKSQKQYINFIKATANMTPDQRDITIDKHVALLIHHMIHDIQDSAQDFHSHRKKAQKAHSEKETSRKQQSVLLKKIEVVLGKIVNEYASHKMSDPDAIQAISHMKENHPLIPRIIKSVVNREITLEEGSKMIVKHIGKEVPHNRYSLHSNLYKKSYSAFNAGLGIPNPPMAYSHNSSSLFRPSPPFILNTFECPDEKFVKRIMKMKEAHDGVVEYEAKDMTHKELSNKIGIPEYRVKDGNLVEE